MRSLLRGRGVQLRRELLLMTSRLHPWQRRSRGGWDGSAGGVTHSSTRVTPIHGMADLGNEIENGIQFIPVCLQCHHDTAAHHVERVLEIAHDQQLGCFASNVEEVNVTIVAVHQSANKRG